jgi:hypothetical protein
MSSSRYVRALQDALTNEVNRLQAQYQAAAQDAAPPESTRRRGVPAPAPSYGVASPPPASAAPPTSQAAGQIVAQLDERIGRLTQVRDWVADDAELAHLIDATIGQQVRASERRQARLSVVLTIVSLIAGWLISLLGSPATLFAHL